MPDDVKGGAREDRLSGPQRVQHREQEYVRKQMVAHAREQCHETRAAYAACTAGRTISIAWACRDVFRDFNDCLKQ